MIMYCRILREMNLNKGFGYIGECIASMSLPTLCFLTKDDSV